jgi:hypothetical protein
MKFYKLLKKLSLFIITFIFLAGLITSNYLKSDRKYTYRHIKSHTPFEDKLLDTKLSNKVNTKIQDPHFSSLNKTFVKKDLKTFKDENNQWDFKLLSRQMDDIFQIFLYQNQKDITPESTRAVIKLFIENFESCDDNKDNILSIDEFKKCVKQNKYFKVFNIDDVRQPKFMLNLIKSNSKWTNITNTDSLAVRMVQIVDSMENGYLNFHDFMMLRLISFAWRKCGNIGFFIDEVNFECAFEVVAKTKTLSRNSARSLFNLALELSNFKSVRYLDLVTFSVVALNSRLYGKINTKNDGDITRNEFMTALESSLLPRRYNKNIIDDFFKLISGPDKKFNDLDLYTFVFLDTLLRMFSMDRPGRSETCITYADFISIINDFNFPKKIIQELYYIPYYNLSRNNYTQFMHVKIPKYFEENDFLMRKYRFKSLNKNNEKSGFKNKRKFLHKFSEDKKGAKKPQEEVTEEIITTTTTTNKTETKQGEGIPNFPNLKAKMDWINKIDTNYAENSYYYILNPRLYESFNFTSTTKDIYHLMDFPQNNCVNFEEYAFFIQVIYLFKRFDKYNKGKLTALALNEDFRKYSEYPKVSHRINERIDKLRIISDETYLNPFYTYALLRVEDVAQQYVNQDFYSESVNEVNIHLILERINIRDYPEDLMRSCLKGYGEDNLNMKVPEYDWVCVVGKAVKHVSTFLETTTNKKITQKHKIKLENTDFYNMKKKK